MTCNRARQHNAVRETVYKKEKKRICFEDPAYLPNCFAGCYVVVFIIQVAEIMSGRQPLQEFSSLDVHLSQEASSPWTQITKAQHHVLEFNNEKMHLIQLPS